MMLLSEKERNNFFLNKTNKNFPRIYYINAEFTNCIKPIQ